jgi:hypothetical protein
MNKEELSKALSISCVENYFLVWAKEYFDIRELYYQSFLPMNEIISDFLQNNAEYADYKKLKRIQDLAEDAGFTTHTLYENLITGNFYNNLVLMRVNKSFFESSKLVPWRSDHYICINKDDCGFKCINNYPLGLIDLSAEDLQKYFDKAVLSYAFKDCARQEYLSEKHEAAFDRIIGSESGFEITENYNLKNLRDALGILKVSRKRTYEWLKLMNERKQFLLDDEICGIFKKNISDIEKLFMHIELSIIRNKADYEYIKTKLEEINGTEKQIPIKVKMRRLKDEKIKCF